MCITNLNKRGRIRGYQKTGNSRLNLYGVRDICGNERDAGYLRERVIEKEGDAGISKIKVGHTNHRSNRIQKSKH